VARLNDFVTIYDVERLSTAIAWHEARAGRIRRQRTGLVLAIVLCLGLSALAEGLSGVDTIRTATWPIIAAALSIAALAVVAGLAAADPGRRTRVHDDAVAALTEMRTRKPAPDAYQDEVLSWVWQVESILRGAQGDLTPPVSAWEGPGPVPRS
jgi:hypothetical protein